MLLMAACQNGDVPDTRFSKLHTIVVVKPLPSICTIDDVYPFMQQFLDAFNSGDQEKLREIFKSTYVLFSVKERYLGQTEFKMFYTRHYDDLMIYFEERHANNEILVLSMFDGSYSEYRKTFEYRFEVVRSADDLPIPNDAYLYSGKGNMSCAEGKILVWSMGIDQTMEQQIGGG